MAEESTSAAVYVSWLTFKNAIESLSQGIPNQIDRSTFPGLSGGVQSQLLAGLKFLGLINDDSTPTDDLHALAVHDENKRKEKLREILKAKYSELFALDLMKTTPNQLSDSIASAYNVSGDTREKAIRFFLAAVNYVGVQVSRLFKQSGSGAGGTRTRRRAASKSKTPAETPPQEDPVIQNPQGTSRVVKLISGGTLTLAGSVSV